MKFLYALTPLFLLSSGAAFGLTTMTLDLSYLRASDFDSGSDASFTTILGQTVPEGSPMTMLLTYDETAPVSGGNDYFSSVVCVDFMFGTSPVVSMNPSTSMIRVGNDDAASPGIEDTFTIDVYDAVSDFSLYIRMTDPTATALSSNALSVLPGTGLGTEIYFGLQDINTLGGVDNDIGSGDGGPGEVSFRPGGKVVAAPVPEPSRSLLLMMAGMAMLCGRRSR